MARPQKEGLEYFPLDVDIGTDDAVEYIEAKYGLAGFGIVIKLFMRIYRNGYYTKWGDKEEYLFAKRINSDVNLIKSVVNEGLSGGLFNSEIYKMYGILTSNGIQKRFIEAIKKRKSVIMIKEYLLLCQNELPNTEKGVSVYINSINSEITQVKDTNNPQSKVKESIEDKNAISDAETLNIDTEALELCKYYETLKPGDSIIGYLAQLKIFITDYKFDWCKEALQKTVIGTGKFVPNYMLKILKDWAVEGKPEMPKPSSKKNDTFSAYPQRQDAVETYKKIEEQRQQEMQDYEVNQSALDKIGKKVKGG